MAVLEQKQMFLMFNIGSSEISVTDTLFVPVARDDASKESVVPEMEDLARADVEV